MTEAFANIPVFLMCLDSDHVQHVFVIILSLPLCWRQFCIVVLWYRPWPSVAWLDVRRNNVLQLIVINLFVVVIVHVVKEAISQLRRNSEISEQRLQLIPIHRPTVIIVNVAEAIIDSPVSGCSLLSDQLAQSLESLLVQSGTPLQLHWERSLLMPVIHTRRGCRTQRCCRTQRRRRTPWSGGTMVPRGCRRRRLPRTQRRRGS
mmetsp:Transcript_167426/g.321573  ORF Transcript_167426/g.321573 Transcript_167426/m.321573 type:complete len:204 (+) Transcript_167426:486-1097(+)